VRDPRSIVLLGGLGQMPFAGVAWQVLQYLEGFRRLGHEVTYVEDTGCWPYNPERDTICDDARPAVRYVAGVMQRIGMDAAWAYRDVVDGAVHGLGETGLAEALRRADVLVNLSGATRLEGLHMDVPVRIYLETDPVLPQIEVARRRPFTVALLAAHTHHFTYGTNFGAPDCDVPIELFHYRPTLPPVVLDWWAAPHDAIADVDGRPFTTVANWRQTAKDVEWQGRRLTWSKDVEFTRFRALPRLVDRPLELALALDDPDAIATLRSAGWRVVPALPMTKSLDAYRDYVRSSAGEFSVAKEQNVRLRSGWFSDRTATYLASGRPAIVQDTGFGRALPAGEGLFAFATLEEALDAFGAVESDYERHSRAARELAAEHLDADRVLARLLAEAGV
jgi:hypothetical protein